MTGFTRRSFLKRVGKGTLAIAVLGPVACSDDGSTATSPATSPAAATTLTTLPPPTTAPPTTSATSPPETTAQGTRADWTRVELGFVSAYILVRNGRAAVVDTGSAGSGPAIEAALQGVGLGWEAVGHVIVTHLHPDHQGSLGAVLDGADQATAYAGAADVSGIDSPRPISPLDDGDEVFGLQIVATPGHTAGHISVLDPLGSVLVAGDALNTSSGEVAGSDPRFTADRAAADDSVRKLALLEFEVLYPGHGEPIIGGADAAVMALAASI